MLTTGRTGRAVAVVSGGEHDGAVIKITEDKPEDEPRRDFHEVLDEGDLLVDTSKFKMLTLQQRLAIAQGIEDGTITVDDVAEALGEDNEGDESPEEKEYEPRAPPQRRVVYRGADPRHLPSPDISQRVAKTYRDKSRYEYRLDDGKMVVLPGKDSERVFVAGKSGAGKSCFAASYIREYGEMYPDRRVFLFSTHDGERAYEQLEHTAIVLNEGFVENPLGLEELKNSLCVFDDCDALQDKKLSAAVDALNLDLINNGRKYNIHVVTLAHQLMEYKKTRGQLNEANRVVFFPQGSAYHNQRFLKVYAGLNGEWVKKILSEKSRWICLDNRIPQSYVTENAVVIIRQAQA